jgi:thiol-disulfide isomerase/thioredoxin
LTSNQSVVTLERFASGMTFPQYLAFIGTAENLAREGTRGEPRRDLTAQVRAWYEASRLTEAQASAIKWLASQPGGPAKILVISEEWSSDCRRDVPMFARLAEAGNLELRIFPRDGKKFGSSERPSLDEAPDSNADIMAEFLNVKNGQTWQSIPVAVFYTKDLEPIHRYIEYPAIYHKDIVVNERIRAPRPGETSEQTRERGDREFMALQQSPFFRVWASAAVDEILTALRERIIK